MLILNDQLISVDSTLVCNTSLVLLTKNNIVRDSNHLSSLCLDGTDLQQLSSFLLQFLILFCFSPSIPSCSLSSNTSPTYQKPGQCIKLMIWLIKDLALKSWYFNVRRTWKKIWVTDGIWTHNPPRSGCGFKSHLCDSDFFPSSPYIKLCCCFIFNIPWFLVSDLPKN